MRPIIRLTLIFFISVTTLDAQWSPEVLADGRVTFRYRSSDAKEIKAIGQFGDEVILKRTLRGQWTGTTREAITPGIYEYRFIVDSQSTIDPRNRMIKPQRWPGTSILHIPATPPAPWDLQDIPHGTLHYHDYQSKALGNLWRNLVVYTPPNAKGPLPVLYLAHGYSDEQRTWTVHGKAHWILDSLIASNKAKPMIIVMPDAHAIAPETRDQSEFDVYGPENSAAFCQELIEDVIPLIEANYPVKKEPSARAFAGLSMGGHHALTIALQHHPHFSQIGAFSSAPPNEESTTKALANVDQINQNLTLLWMACGDEDFLFDRNEQAHAAYKEAGLRHEYIVTKGDDHSWPVWRRYLVEFVPKLFGDQANPKG